MIVRRTSDRASRADTNEHCYSVRTVYLYVNNFVILERLYIYIYIGAVIFYIVLTTRFYSFKYTCNLTLVVS